MEANFTPEICSFIDGQYYQLKGWDCPADAPDAFVRGYAYEYECEQVMSHRSENVNHRAA